MHVPQRGSADGRRSLTTRQSIMNQAPRKKYSLGNRQHTTAKHDIPDQPDAKPAAPDRHCRNQARIHSNAKRSPCSPCALAPAQHRTFSLIQVSYTRKIRHAERKCRAPQSWSRPQGATRCAHWMLRIDFCCRISQSSFPDTCMYSGCRFRRQTNGAVNVLLRMLRELSHGTSVMSPLTLVVLDG